MTKVLVVGATGLLGTEICSLLAAKGIPLRALFRSTTDQGKVDKLRSVGAELVRGDLRDRSSLDAACQGMTAVISTAASMPSSYHPVENNFQTVDLEGMTNLVNAAHSAGVSRFIYISFSGGIDLDFPFRNAKRAVEQHLRNSGLVYTILRPSYFMEVWLSPPVGFDAANAKVQIYGTGKNPISWISFKDVAQFAVESLDNPAAQSPVLELGGPEALSPLQVVRIFEEVGGKAFEVQHIPEESLQTQHKAATEPMQLSLAALMLCYAQGDAIDMQKTLKTFPLKLTSVRDYAESVYSVS